MSGIVVALAQHRDAGLTRSAAQFVRVRERVVVLGNAAEARAEIVALDVRSRHTPSIAKKPPGVIVMPFRWNFLSQGIGGS